MAANKAMKHLAAVACSFLVIGQASALAAPVELTLDDSIALALKNNPSIKMAVADKDSAAWKISEAKSANGFNFSFTHTDTRYKKVTSSSGGAFSINGVPSGRIQIYGGATVYNNNYDNKFTLTKPLYTGGKVEGLVQQAKLGLDVADLTVTKSQQQVKLDATTGYFGVLQARNMVTVSQESVNSMAEHVKNVQAQFSVGTVAKSDVLRSEVELANSQQTLIKAQNAYDLAVASLNNVIGMPLSTEIVVKDELKYNKYPMSLEDCIAAALKNRPESLQVDKAVEVAQEGIKVAKSGYKPTVAFSASDDWSDSDFPGTTGNNWTASIVTSFNVFDSGSTDSKVKQANAALLKSQEQARQSKDSIQLETRQAFLNMKEAEKRIETSSVTVTKAEEDTKIAAVRYNAGVGTNIDVIDAQLALTNAKTNYVQALYDYNTSKAKLEKAMGVAIK